MRKNLFLKALLCVVLMSPLFAMAQNLESQGFKKTKSIKIGGYQCDYYADDQDNIRRVFYKDDGDYFIDVDDEDGMNREPGLSKYSVDHKITYPVGCAEEKGRLTFPNGTCITGITGNFLKWKDFKEEVYKKERRSFGNYWPTYKGGFYEFLWGMRNGSVGNLEIILPDNTEEKHKLCTILNIYGDGFTRESGFVLNDRLYNISENGELLSVAQKVGDTFYYAADCDTITEVKTSEEIAPSITTVFSRIGETARFKATDVYYKNGDKIQLCKGYITSGKIHRNGGILKFKEKDGRAVINYPNGDIFAGDFVYSNNSNGLEYAQILKYTDLPLKNGTLQKEDGSFEEIIGGKTEEQRKKEQELKNAENQKIYNERCQKYGKQYYDAFLQGEIIVGTPESLIKDLYWYEKKKEVGNATLYYISGSKTVYRYPLHVSHSIWMRNGRVISVRIWR